jgi:hypothetical protein
MKRKGLSGVELRAEVERLRGAPVPNQMWMSRRLTGDVNLVRPVRVVYGPTEDLKVIAKALDVDPDRLVRVINVGAKRKTTADQTETPAATDQDAATSTSAE